MIHEYEFSRKGGGRPKPLLYQINDNGCWENVSHTKDKDGYGKIQVEGKSLRIHRLVYQIENQVSLKEDEVVRHKCDNPSCFNPNHLEIGTVQDNTNDRTSRGRGARNENHGRAKLTNEQVIEIYHAIGSQTSIASKYGISQKMVSLIKNGKNHQNLF